MHYVFYVMSKLIELLQRERWGTSLKTIARQLATIFASVEIGLDLAIRAEHISLHVLGSAMTMISVPCWQRILWKFSGMPGEFTIISREHLVVRRASKRLLKITLD